MSRIDDNFVRPANDNNCDSRQCDERIFRAQQSLNAWAKMSWLKEDGIIGKKTREALKRFQQEHGLSVTGELDAATEQALLQVSEKSHEQPKDNGANENHKNGKNPAQSRALAQSPSVRFSVSGALQTVKDGARDGVFEGLKQRGATALKQQVAEFLDEPQRDIKRYVDGSVRWAESLGVLGSDRQTKVAQQNDDIINLAFDVTQNPQEALKSIIKTVAEDAIKRAAAGPAGSKGAANDVLYELSKKQVAQFTDLVAGRIIGEIIKTPSYKDFKNSVRSSVREVAGAYAVPLTIAEVGVELQAAIGKMAAGSEALRKSNPDLYRQLDGTSLKGAAEFENMHYLHFLIAPYQEQIDAAARAYVVASSIAKAS